MRGSCGIYIFTRSRVEGFKEFREFREFKVQGVQGSDKGAHRSRGETLEPVNLLTL
jgi:hypothetical protein